MPMPIGGKECVPMPIPSSLPLKPINKWRDDDGGRRVKVLLLLAWPEGRMSIGATAHFLERFGTDLDTDLDGGEAEWEQERQMAFPHFLCRTSPSSSHLIQVVAFLNVKGKRSDEIGSGRHQFCQFRANHELLKNQKT